LFQFPAALPEFFIKLLTEEGDTVVDPFAGSNTTGIVAEGLKRRWIAMGRVPEYLEASEVRVALLMLGFTYDSRFQVEAWAKRFRQDFGTKPGVTFFEIPMIGGMARMGKWFIDSGMRRVRLRPITRM
jgi:hypothetical protein